MKRSICLSLFMFVLLSSLFALLNLGIKIGGILLYMDICVDDKWLEQSSIAGFHAGLTTVVNLMLFFEGRFYN